MSAGSKLTGLLLASVLCLPVAGQADTPTAHRAHKVKKPPPPPPPLPSGTRGPVPQIPLDAIPAVIPQVSYQNGMLTIVAPNSTLGDILRSIRKQTAADIEIPGSATERVATRLGPGPARQILAELLNGSHFNYILLGSPDNANLLTRVVLVAKTPDTPVPPAAQAPNPNNPAPGGVTNIAADNPDAPDEAVDENPDQPTEAEQQPPEVPPDQPGVKTPQQLLQEMQQRQLQMQQQANQPGQPGPQVYPPPGMPRPPQQPQQQPQEQQ
jgi:hypothetical protein